jgi:hypothetical protein
VVVDAEVGGLDGAPVEERIGRLGHSVSGLEEADGGEEERPEGPGDPLRRRSATAGRGGSTRRSGGSHPRHHAEKTGRLVPRRAAIRSGPAGEGTRRMHKP